MKNDVSVQTPPKGWAILAVLGPGIVWTSELVGSGEVILTTRNGAILGTAILWAVLIGIFLVFGYFFLFQIPAIL
jgi:Mn2+/Fe2+ NRAMP family transporter